MKSQSSGLRTAETGRKTQPAFLYFLQYQAGANYFFTNFDQDISVAGATLFSDPQTFTSAQIKHQPFTEDVETRSSPISVSLAANDTELRKYFVSAPVQQISIKIFRLNSTALPGPINFADLYQEFSGVAIAVSFAGYQISASFLPPVLQEDHQIPNFVYQKTCNHILYGKFCTVNKATWAISTIVMAVNRVQKTVDIPDLTVNSKTITNETFQGGQFNDAQGNKIGIIAAEMLPSSAGVRLYLNSWPSPSVTDIVTVYPGCLKIPRICDKFFANINNFGGTPCIPITNPVVNGISS